MKSLMIWERNEPWLSPASIEFLKNVLNKDVRFLEMGSGESTLFFASRVKKLHSIEHNEEWYQLIKTKLSQKNHKNVDYILHKPHFEELKRDIEARHLREFDHESENYRSYYEQINIYSDSIFDFILIDGRARVECCQRAKSKLKSGGTLILDNSERRQYKPIFEMLSDWKMVNTTNGLWDTTLWFKP
jgi:predicted O-methyltransferase YrrM